MSERNHHRGTAIRSDRRGILFLVSALVILLDRVTKIAVAHMLPLGGEHVVIPKVFWISHVLNTGAAFSLFGDTASPERVRWLLVGFSLIAAVIVGIVLVRIGRRITRDHLRSRADPRRGHRQRVRPHPHRRGHRLSGSPHRALPLARLQRRRLLHRHAAASCWCCTRWWLRENNKPAGSDQRRAAIDKSRRRRLCPGGKPYTEECIPNPRRPLRIRLQ